MISYHEAKTELQYRHAFTNQLSTLQLVAMNFLVIAGALTMLGIVSLL